MTRRASACRVCHSTDLLPYLDLGDQPLANRLLRTPDALVRRYPLGVQACTRCTLSQLTHVIDATDLFDAYYVYQSGVSAGWHRHCADLATKMGNPGESVIDIGSNDGTLLRYFQQRGCRVLGVDPAASRDSDAPNGLNEFWTSDLVREAGLRADRIIAQNVLGHVDDVHDFMEGIKLALRPNGVAIIEVPDLRFLMAKVAFDTIYHEHHSYWTFEALQTLVTAHQLGIVSCYPLPKMHGGSIRVYLQHGIGFSSDSHEWGSNLRDPETYQQFGDVVQQTREQIEIELERTPVFHGFTAPAKATVLLNFLHLPNRLSAIFDDTPAKWGCYVPGVGIPIQRPTDLRDIEHLIAFAWNWLPEIQRRLRALGFRGRLFVPLPTPRWIT